MTAAVALIALGLVAGCAAISQAILGMVALQASKPNLSMLMISMAMVESLVLYVAGVVFYVLIYL